MRRQRNRFVAEALRHLCHPRIEYPPARTQETVEQHLVRTVMQALRDTDGDVLAFLPGRREIERARGMLERAEESMDVVPLHGELSLAEQQLADPGRREAVMMWNPPPALALYAPLAIPPVRWAAASQAA